MNRSHSIAYNGKSIGEVREKGELKVQFSTKLSRYFFHEVNLLKNYEMEK